MHLKSEKIVLESHNELREVHYLCNEKLSISILKLKTGAVAVVYVVVVVTVMASLPSLAPTMLSMTSCSRQGVELF